MECQCVMTSLGRVPTGVSLIEFTTTLLSVGYWKE